MRKLLFLCVFFVFASTAFARNGIKYPVKPLKFQYNDKDHQITAEYILDIVCITDKGTDLIKGCTCVTKKQKKRHQPAVNIMFVCSDNDRSEQSYSLKILWETNPEYGTSGESVVKIADINSDAPTAYIEDVRVAPEVQTSFNFVD